MANRRTGLTIADLAEEDRKRLDEVFVQAPGGTVAPRAWNGWRAGREFEDRKRQRGEEEVRCVNQHPDSNHTAISGLETRIADDRSSGKQRTSS